MFLKFSTRLAKRPVTGAAIVRARAFVGALALLASGTTSGAGADLPSAGDEPPLQDQETPAMPEKNPKAAPREKPRDAPKIAKTRTKIKAQNIVQAQPYKATESQEISGENGQSGGKATLVNLNQNVNAWYLLSIRWPDKRGFERVHLENPDPRNSTLSLAIVDKAKGLKLTTAGQPDVVCDIWSQDFQDEIKKGRDARSAFAPLCDGKIYMRNQVDGRKTTKEWVVEFLRENVWGGEAITTFVKEKLFKDKFLISSDSSDGGDGSAARHQEDVAGPIDGLADPKFANQLVEPAELGITAKLEDSQKLLLGKWYKNPANKGVYISAMIPGKVADKILASYDNLVPKLDNVEANATSYLVAFDMSYFDLGFAMGTDHPAVDWSGRALPEEIDRTVGGPDGYATWDPLVTTGMVNPNLAKKVVAAFTGGFKRDHGAFKWGALASMNHGSHYGFVESGVAFSKLNPGLSTLAVFKDGKIEMKTWTDADADRAKDVMYARQNGVPLIEWKEELKQGIPGNDVRSWGAGNWSGSEDSKFRTLRAGICLQERDGKQFLVYGYFSSVTPSAMARVFQAYGCRYAMHLDMNALEHTYLSVFPSDGHNVTVEHLINGMKVLDKSFQDKSIPRFIGFPDNRDFFYLWRKKE